MMRVSSQLAPANLVFKHEYCVCELAGMNNEDAMKILSYWKLIQKGRRVQDGDNATIGQGDERDRIDTQCGTGS